MSEKENVEGSMNFIKDLLLAAPMLRFIEKQVISILLVRGLVKLLKNTNSVEDYRFDNIEFTSKGEELVLDNVELSELDSLVSILEDEVESRRLITVLSSQVEDYKVEEFRNLFPAGARGPGKKIVKARLERFITDNECTIDNVIEAAKLYIKHNSSKGYNIAQAHYFLYRKDPDTGIIESKCEEFVEQVKMGKHIIKDWRDETV